MGNSQKSSTLISLSKQLDRLESDIIAFRKSTPLYVADLKQLVIAICNQLASSPLERFALVMNDSFDFVAGLLALLYSGKKPILFNPLFNEMNSHYQAVLTDGVMSNEAWSAKPSINIHQLEKNHQTYFDLNDFQSTELILFTSGSTGLPKPIIKTIQQLEKESEILADYLNLLSNHLTVASVTHDHLYGLTFKIMLSLTNKLPFVCESIQYQEQLSQYSDKKIIYVTTPSIIKTLDNQIKATPCDKVISAGGALSFDQANLSLQCLGVLPNEIYGSSETGIIASRSQYQQNAPWQLFPQMRLEFSDKQTQLSSPLLHQQERLNDKLICIDDQHFYLNGRVDKIVKISEKRVSLTHIENLLKQLIEIIDVKVIPLEQQNRTILAAVVQLSEIGQQRQQLGHFQLSQFFRQQLKDKLSLVTVPKKWRFVEQLPINTQGKSTYIELKSLFDKSELIMNNKMPNILKTMIDEKTADLVLHVPADLFWFKGHFNSQPLLPGVVQINWAMHYCKILLNIQSEIKSIDIIKFQLPILPNDTISLHIEWDKNLKKLHFTYRIDNKVASSGKFKLCP